MHSCRILNTWYIKGLRKNGVSPPAAEFGGAGSGMAAEFGKGAASSTALTAPPMRVTANDDATQYMKNNAI
jgi:hypothetical protein